MKSIEPQKSICSSGWEGSGVRPLVIVSSGNIDTPCRGLKKVHTLLSEEAFGYNQWALISYDIKINYLFYMFNWHFARYRVSLSYHRRILALKYRNEIVPGACNIFLFLNLKTSSLIIHYFIVFTWTFHLIYIVCYSIRTGW